MADFRTSKNFNSSGTATDGYDVFSARADGVDIILAKDINDLSDSVIETQEAIADGYAVTTIAARALPFTTTGQVLRYNSATDKLEVGTVGGGFSTSIITTSGNTASANDEALIDTSTLAITLNLPSSPSIGDRVRMIDGKDNASANTITAGRNSENIDGVAADFTISTNGAAVEFVYMDATEGWRTLNLG